MTDLYLIAHKVRGEPAFDIAILLDTLDEDGDLIWIIPTSGHRAYPWHYWPWDELYCDSRRSLGDIDPVEITAPPMPPNHPDHYACNDRPVRGAPSLLDRLNLKPAQPPIIRRI
jgi:hypothetical protein